MGLLLRQIRLLRRKLKKHWLTMLWLSVCVGVFYVEFIRYKDKPQYYYLRRMLGVGMYVSRGTAAVLNLSCCLLIIPMCRGLALSLSSTFSKGLSLLCSSSKGGLQPLPPLPALISTQASQTAKSLHILIAVTVLTTSSAHTLAHIMNALNFSWHYDTQYPGVNVFKNQGENPLLFFIATVPGVTGVALLTILILLAATSMKWTRTRNYNAFFYTHYLGLLFYLLLLVHPHCGVLKEQMNIDGHAPGCQMLGISFMDNKGVREPHPTEYVGSMKNDSRFALPQGPYHGNYLHATNDEKPRSNDKLADGVLTLPQSLKCKEAPVFHSIYSQTWAWISCALIIWLIECTIHWRRQKSEVCVIEVLTHPCNVVQLTLHQSGFTCLPGQYMLLQCPNVSRFEWHPFTVICSPSKYGKNTFTILIREQGDWSSHVSLLLRSSLNSSSHGKPSLKDPPIISTVTSAANEACLQGDGYPYIEPKTSNHVRVSIKESPVISSVTSVATQSCLEEDTFAYIGYRNPLINSPYCCVDKQISLDKTMFTSVKYEPFTHICKQSKISTTKTVCNCYYYMQLKDLHSIEYSEKCHSTPPKFIERNFQCANNSLHKNCQYTALKKLKKNHSLPDNYSSYNSGKEHCRSTNGLSCTSGLNHTKCSCPCTQKCTNEKINYFEKCAHTQQKINQCTFSCMQSDPKILCVSDGISNYTNKGQWQNEHKFCLQRNETEVYTKCTGSQHEPKWNEDEIKPSKDVQDTVVDLTSHCFPRLKVDGPYSSPSEEMLQYGVIIGAAGGIGITPLAATLSHKVCHLNTWPRRIHMVWVVKEAGLLLVLAPLISSLLLQCWKANKEDSLEIRLHVTMPTTSQSLQDLFLKYPSILPRITQGRPNWKSLFHEWRSTYRRQRVGVFACGPRKMCDQVKRRCLQGLSHGSAFEYHQECFT